MAAFWMCEVPPTGIAGSDALNQLACREALLKERARRVRRAASLRQPLRVLIVDDDHDTTDTLAKLVTGWHYTSRSAYDGVAALRAAAIQHPHVVLLDATMPGMDGCRVARQLRLDYSAHDCFIIAFAGDGDERTRQRCVDAGIDVVLIKPVESFVVETLLMLECERVNRAPYHLPPRLASSTTVVGPANPPGAMQRSDNGLSVGQDVEVVQGALAGVAGVLNRLLPNHRCQVALGLLQPGVFLVIDQAAVRRYSLPFDAAPWYGRARAFDGN